LPDNTVQGGLSYLKKKMNEITGFVNVILIRIYVNRVKVPDVAIFPGKRMWPTVAFEFGYAEPYEQLKEDVKLLLEGAGGEISKVIVVKLEPLVAGETEIRAGFVEMWGLAGGKAKNDGGRKVIFF